MNKTQCGFEYIYTLPKNAKKSISFTDFIHTTKRIWRHVETKLQDHNAMIEDMLKELKKAEISGKNRWASDIKNHLHRSLGMTYYIYSPYSETYFIKTLHEHTNFKILNKYIKDGNVYFIPRN